jgi:hypothetical protein
MSAVEPFFPLLAVCARAQPHPAQVALLREHTQAPQQWDALPAQAEAHGLVGDFRDWPYSSYHVLCSTQPTELRCDEVLAWFGGPMQLAAAHRPSSDDPRFAALSLEDFD